MTAASYAGSCRGSRAAALPALASTAPMNVRILQRMLLTPLACFLDLVRIVATFRALGGFG